MKNLIVLASLLSASTAYAADFSTEVECTAVSYRISYFDSDFNNYAKFNFDIKSVNGKVEAESYGGFFSVSDYNGVFQGQNLPEVPYTRTPQKYKNHYRFKDLDANYTFGSETGMWGYFVLNKKIATASRGDVVDGHYVLQAGDHFGGTVDFDCVKGW
jgi:hypothetical protein